jgi:hypothetical protein
MTVNLVFSTTSAGDSMADTQDSGAVIPGTESDIINLFVRHDAVNAPITNCAWYITRCVSDNYTGENANDDLVEILGWGDLGNGFQINQVIPVGWTDGDEFDSSDWLAFRNGSGDINNQIILDEDSLSIGTPAGDGIIPVGGESHVQLRWKVPSSVPSGSGTRGLTLVMAYSATS